MSTPVFRRSPCGRYAEVALVLGLGENGLGVIRCLAHDPRIRIIGIGVRHSVGSFSRHLSDRFLVDSLDERQIKQLLYHINSRYDCVVPFPTGNDFWVRILCAEQKNLDRFRIEYDPDTDAIMSKAHQRIAAESLKIPYPRSIPISSAGDLSALNLLSTPFIVKPTVRAGGSEAFRLRVFHTTSEATSMLLPLVADGSFLASELIPGDDSELFTFGSYAHNGEIISSFVGRKLAQVPRGFGTAGIAQLLPAGLPFEDGARQLLLHFRYTGISQIEYKRDRRTGDYYLIEMNPRAWKWIQLGVHAGANLPLVQFARTTGKPQPSMVAPGRILLWVSEDYLFQETFLKARLRWMGLVFREALRSRVVFSIFAANDPGPLCGFLNGFLMRLHRRLRRQFRNTRLGARNHAD